MHQTVADESAQANTSKVITISGGKIERVLQQTTASIGFIGADTLENKPLHSIKEAFGLLGNVRDSDWVDAGIIIRGVNSEGVGGPSGSSLATLYIDGIAQTYQATRRGALGIWDVKQLEVFRGPQSTTTGRNALAGALYIKTKDPVFDTEAAFKAGVGSDNHHNLAVMGNTQLSESFAVRVAAESVTENGQVSYPDYAGLPYLDERANDEYWQIRAKALYQPNGEDGVRALLTYSSSYDSPSYSDVDGANANHQRLDWCLIILMVYIDCR